MQFRLIVSILKSFSTYRKSEQQSDFFVYYILSLIIIEIFYGLIKLFLQLYVAIEIVKSRRTITQEDVQEPQIFVTSCSDLQDSEENLQQETPQTSHNSYGGNNSPPPSYETLFTLHNETPTYSEVKIVKT